MAESVADRVERLKKEHPLPVCGLGTSEWKELRESQGFWDKLIDEVSCGGSVTYFARQHRVKHSVLNAWLSRFKEGTPRFEEYAAARRARANAMADRMLEYVEQIGAGLISPPQGRVMIDALRWMAARLDPHIWGDKLHIDAKIQSTTELHLAAVKQMADQVKQGGNVYEGEYVDPEELLS